MKDNRRARSARGCQDRRSDLCTLLRRSCSRPLLPHSLQAASPVALKRDLTSFSTSCALPCWCYCLERGAAMTRRPQRSSSRCARSPRLIRLLKPCSARRDPPAIQQRKACVFSHLTPRATGLPQSMRARRADRRCLAVWRPARCPACRVGCTWPAMGRVEPAASSPLFPDWRCAAYEHSVHRAGRRTGHHGSACRLSMSSRPHRVLNRPYLQCTQLAARGAAAHRSSSQSAKAQSTPRPARPRPARQRAVPRGTA